MSQDTSPNVEAPEPAARRVGAVVAGKYRLEEPIGRGGMGAVYRAQHVLTHRRVALKWLLVDDEAMRRRFIQEARAMGALEHPNVVGVIDIGEWDGAVYLVMEYVEGETVREHLRRSATPPERAIRLLMPALEGVAAAHQAGLVHRDLKPANLFVCLDRDGTAYGTKVLDFGVALSIRPRPGPELTQSGMVVGTPRYMAPEQLRGRKKVDPRADQYALGLILYEMLTGRLPYSSDVYEALVIEIATQAPVSPRVFEPTIPKALAGIVLRALEKRPDDRFPSIEAFARALEPFGGGVRFEPPRLAHARRSVVEPDDEESALEALTPRGSPATADERTIATPVSMLEGAYATTTAAPPHRRPSEAAGAGEVGADGGGDDERDERTLTEVERAPADAGDVVASAGPADRDAPPEPAPEPLTNPAPLPIPSESPPRSRAWIAPLVVVTAVVGATLWILAAGTRESPETRGVADPEDDTEAAPAPAAPPLVESVAHTATATADEASPTRDAGDDEREAPPEAPSTTEPADAPVEANAAPRSRARPRGPSRSGLGAAPPQAVGRSGRFEVSDF